MLVCMRCGKQNQPNENYCLFCGATLPKIAYTMEMAAVEQKMDLYYKFEEWCNKVKVGQVSLNDFEAFLNDTYNKLREREEDIRNVDISEEMLSEFSEELDMGFSGIDMVNEGMEIINQYLDEQETQLLDEGLILVKQGLERVHKAQTLSREREKLLSMDIEMYRQDQTMEL